MAVDPGRALVVGVDFGTLPGRVLVVRIRTWRPRLRSWAEWRSTSLSRSKPMSPTTTSSSPNLRRLHDYFGRGETR